MSVLILKNYPLEGPGTIEDYLLENRLDYRTVDLPTEGLPSSENIDTLVIMGGPMSVNDSEVYPFIAREIELVREFINDEKKVLGICLGAQIMARALGARVYPGPEKEIGWYDIELPEDGIRDPLMARLATHPVAGDFRRTLKVFHWHGETFDLPVGASLLGKSALYPNQAFRYGKKAYAFQFHIEVRKEMVCDWLRNEPVDIARIDGDTEMYYEDYYGRAVNFYKAFFGN